MTEEEELVQKQVRAFLKELEAYYGVDPKEIHQLFEDVRWAANYRKKLDAVGSWASKSVIGIIAAAILLALWEGIKEAIHR